MYIIDQITESLPRRTISNIHRFSYFTISDSFLRYTSFKLCCLWMVIVEGSSSSASTASRAKRMMSLKDLVIFRSLHYRRQKSGFRRNLQGWAWNMWHIWYSRWTTCILSTKKELSRSDVSHYSRGDNSCDRKWATSRYFSITMFSATCRG